MMAEEQQERTEQATAKRRQDFREKGQVAQSKEVQTAALLTAFLLLVDFLRAPISGPICPSLLAGIWRMSGKFRDHQTPSGA